MKRQQRIASPCTNLCSTGGGGADEQGTLSRTPKLHAIEEEIRQLTARRDAVLSAGATQVKKDRQLRIILPLRDDSLPTAPSDTAEPTPAAANTTDGNNTAAPTSGNSNVTAASEEDSAAVRALVMRRWRRLVAEQRATESEGFMTEGARRLERLRAERVYPFIVVRVALPDGLTLQFRASVRETIEDLHKVIREVLVSRRMSSAALSFDLHLPLCRDVLRPSATLEEARISPPAARLMLKWRRPDDVARIMASGRGGKHGYLNERGKRLLKSAGRGQ
ncbi:unnamed protein product [Vitrella brassicaformis CCMP3155]|uniref:UBX domain-containing protein n=1 Tax=Vitrella brassicaformis (strain CCMP3155) TaxID=1169540 RepID=A0A0G4FVM0_VITBC|nr:unnamed protein product [Vitrella brassicaformis CCMP3155]|eukprot:CEM18594.1 unnamed protein product [Vitrella brassicaformis CCMP3155]